MRFNMIEQIEQVARADKLEQHGLPFKVRA